MTKVKINCIGELLIDMFCTDVDVKLQDGENFKRMAGGAPLNVAATIATLGGESAMIGKVGSDAFGTFLIDTLNQFKVDTSLVLRDDTLPTTMAFVSLQADGERDFEFSRGADGNISLEDLPLDALLDVKMSHFGSATALLDGKLRETYIELIRQSKAHHNFVSFDPNYRIDLWKDNTAAFIERSKQAIFYADLVKVSEEELAIVTQEEDVDKAIDILHEYGAKIIVVTLGKEGSILSTSSNREIVPSIAIKSIDSTGAGDAFMGAVLYQIAKRLEVNGEVINDFDFLKDAVYFANHVGAKVCTKIGSLTALSTLDDMEQ